MTTSAVHSIVATQNWIIKTSNYKVNVAHQSDTALIAIQVLLHLTISRWFYLFHSFSEYVNSISFV